MSFRHVVILAALALSAWGVDQEIDGIKVRSIDPKSIKLENLDFSAVGGGAGRMSGDERKFDVSQIKSVIVKVHFREKYLKKKGALELSAELEELLVEQELAY